MLDPNTHLDLGAAKNECGATDLKKLVFLVKYGQVKKFPFLRDCGWECRKMLGSGERWKIILGF